MSSTPTNPAAENRRKRLREWIDTHFGGMQASFIASTNDGEKQMNQGELSALLGRKSFGERRARSLELLAGMPPGYLDEVPKPNPYRVEDSIKEHNTVTATQPTGWPFTHVTLRRILELKKALGSHRGVEAINDIDEILELAVQKWERRADRKKSSAA